MVNIPYLPFWRAWGDGKELKIVPANMIHMAIPILAGTKKVVLRYCRPLLRERLSNTLGVARSCPTREWQLRWLLNGALGGKVIGAGTKKELAGEDIRRLMAGGAEMADLEQELSAIWKTKWLLKLEPLKFLDEFQTSLS